jgi:TPR repeat protein
LELGKHAGAIPLLRAAAAGGHQEAQSVIGYDLIVAGRRSEGEAMLRQAADAGYPGAQYELASLYHGILRTQEEADRLFEQAVSGWQQRAQSGEAEPLANYSGALRAVGRTDEADAAVAQAIRAYEQLAADGDLTAMCRLGECYDAQGDLEQTELWYRRAAQAGSAAGAYCFASVLLERGDRAGAVRWFKKAARRGHASAMFNLSHLRRFPWQTGWWLRRAVRAGERGAMNNLAVILKQNGRIAAARRWYLRAIELGDPYAKGNLDVLGYRTF